MAYSYETIKNILSYAVALVPDSAFPLDGRAYFGSYDAAYTAAQSAKPAGSSESKYFYGQQLYVVENDVVTTYLIQTNGTLKEVGAVTLGDNKTISLSDNGVLSLKSFGVGYYAYIPKDVVIEGEYTTVDELPAANAGEYALVGESYYKYNGSAWTVAEDGFTPNTEAKHVYTEGWKTGLEPKVVASASGDGYELAWYEPSSTTVEGLTSIVAGVQTNVDNLAQAVVNNKAEAAADVEAEAKARTEADDALRERIATNEASITTLNGDASTEGSVLKKINDVLVQLVGDGTADTIDSLTELVEWANEHNTDVVEMNNQITKNKTDISAINTLLGTLPEGVTATTVIAYIAEAVSNEQTRAEAAEKELGDRLTDVEGAVESLGTAAEKDVEFFATAEQGAKADTAIQSVVASDNGYISVDNNKVKAYELPSAKVNQLGGVIPDGTSITTDDSGKVSVAAVNYDKVTGLDTQLTATQNAAVESANDYTDENALAKSDIVTTETVAESIEAASEGKVISEKVLLDMLTWKETM